MFVYIVSYSTQYHHVIKEINRGQLTAFRKMAKENGWVIHSVEKIASN